MPASQKRHVSSSLSELQRRVKMPRFNPALRPASRLTTARPHLSPLTRPQSCWRIDGRPSSFMGFWHCLLPAIWDPSPRRRPGLRPTKHCSPPDGAGVSAHPPSPDRLGADPAYLQRTHKLAGSLNLIHVTWWRPFAEVPNAHRARAMTMTADSSGAACSSPAPGHQMQTSAPSIIGDPLP